MLPKKILLLDLEANGFKPDTIWCICTKEYHSKIKRTFLDPLEFLEYFKEFNPDLVVAHNGIGYDFPVINLLVEEGLIDYAKVLDTFVLSRLVDYDKFNTHSLKELGLFLGVHKGDYTGGFDALSREMVEYCEQDVEVLEVIFEYFLPYIESSDWTKSIETEQGMAILCREMHLNGFFFDLEKAYSTLKDVESDMSELEASFFKSFPPKRQELKRLKAKTTKEGAYFAKVQQAMDEFPDWELQGDELVVYHEVPFKPGSPIDRIDVLWDAGWKPYDKTKAHIALERKERNSRWKKY